MLQIAGKILDVYDDPRLEVLLGRHGVEGVREKFAFEIPDSVDLDALDDDAFGAIFYLPEKIASDSGPRRAWPVHEPGVCAISVEYFDKVASDGRVFPDEVRNQIASNIVANADLHGVDVPDEMRKWAADEGEFLPDNNWINLAAYSSPGREDPTQFAVEKRAAGGVARLYPLDDAECVAASIDTFTKVGWDTYGLSEWEARIAANRIVKAATEHGVGVPEDLAVFAELQVKTAEEIHGALLSRIERVPVAMRNTPQKVAALQEAIAVIEGRDDPVKMAAGVAEFDLGVGFGEEHYIAGLCRPELVIFEPAQKTAEVSLLDRIGREKVSTYLGADALAEFEKDAEAAFAAQPEDVREFLISD